MQESGATKILQAMGAGDPTAAAALMPLVYEELRSIASRYLSRERKGHTLSTTALVHESYLRLVGSSKLAPKSRAHFCAIAAVAIRRILIDSVRTRSAKKAIGARRRITISEELGLLVDQEGPEHSLDLLSLDESLQKLAESHPRAADVVQMKFFAGMSSEDIASVLDVTDRTVENDWKFARIWLLREMSKER